MASSIVTSRSRCCDRKYLCSSLALSSAAVRLTSVSAMLFPLGPHRRACPQPERVEANKSSRVRLIVSALVGFHRGDVRIVETDRTLATSRDDVALVEL